MCPLSLIDSHCHFDFDAFDGERQEIWQQCQQVGISHLVIPGVNPHTLPSTAQLTEQLPGIYMAAGLHPWNVENWLEKPSEKHLTELLAEHLNHPRCVAVGECGLDAYLDTPIEQQLPLFEQQLKLACDTNMPVILHVLKTHNTVIELLKKYRPPKGGVVHAFSGSTELGQSYWKLGFYLGISGTITYQRARKTREAVKQLPLESLLLETDAPDMPLSGRQGKINSPLYLPEVANCLADLRGESVEQIANQTSENSRQLFHFF